MAERYSKASKQLREMLVFSDKFRTFTGTTTETTTRDRIKRYFAKENDITYPAAFINFVELGEEAFAMGAYRHYRLMSSLRLTFEKEVPGASFSDDDIDDLLDHSEDIFTEISKMDVFEGSLDLLRWMVDDDGIKVTDLVENVDGKTRILSVAWLIDFGVGTV